MTVDDRFLDSHICRTCRATVTNYGWPPNNRDEQQAHNEWHNELEAFMERFEPFVESDEPDGCRFHNSPGQKS